MRDDRTKSTSNECSIGFPEKEPFNPMPNQKEKREPAKTWGLALQTEEWACQEGSVLKLKSTQWSCRGRGAAGESESSASPWDAHPVNHQGLASHHSLSPQPGIPPFPVTRKFLLQDTFPVLPKRTKPRSQSSFICVPRAPGR